MKFPVIGGLRALELGSPGPMRERLNGLVLAGVKCATAGTLEEYEDNELEEVGERLALVGDNLEKVGVVEVTNTSLTTFAAVPWSFAVAEGEQEDSMEEWRNSHRGFWEDAGLVVTDDMPVFLIYFRLITP